MIQSRGGTKLTLTSSTIAGIQNLQHVKILHGLSKRKEFMKCLRTVERNSINAFYSPLQGRLNSGYFWRAYNKTVQYTRWQSIRVSCSRCLALSESSAFNLKEKNLLALIGTALRKANQLYCRTTSALRQISGCLQNGISAYLLIRVSF